MTKRNPSLRRETFEPIARRTGNAHSQSSCAPIPCPAYRRITLDTSPDHWVLAPSNEQLHNARTWLPKLNNYANTVDGTRTRTRTGLNGKTCSRTVPVTQTLASLLREGFGLSTSISCGEGNCGTCSVFVDGQPVRSCLMLAVQASGRVVTSLRAGGSIASTAEGVC